MVEDSRAVRVGRVVEGGGGGGGRWGGGGGGGGEWDSQWGRAHSCECFLRLKKWWG